MVGAITTVYSVKNLFLSKEIAQLIVPALQELVEGRRIEVLPARENIFLEGLELQYWDLSRRALGHSFPCARSPVTL